MGLLQKQCDYLVLGGGSGGLASARKASMYGAKVIIVEVNRLGGTCVNVGCVPKKMTWNAASVAETIKHASTYGFSVNETKPFDWLMFKHKRDAQVRRLNSIHEKHLLDDKVEYLHGLATFVDPYTVKVVLDDEATEIEIKAQKILVAVGGYPSIPESIPGAEHGITSDGFFDLEQQPKKIAIVGAGYIAVELAGMFNALGTETHLFMRNDTFLRAFDPLIQGKLVAEYKRQGIHLHKSASVTNVTAIDGSIKRIEYKERGGQAPHFMDADCLVWAIGRTPELERLNIEVAGVKVNKKQELITDEYQNTSAGNIYALGDACDRGYQLTPVAIAAGRKLAERLFGGPIFHSSRLDYSNIPSVVFAHPTVGSIGLTEPAAREKYGDDIKVYTSEFSAMFYTVFEPEDKPPTSYKIICVGKDEKIVGLHILGLGSDEIMQGFGVAIKMGACKTDLDNCVAIHPTSAEELVTMR